MSTPQSIALAAPRLRIRQSTLGTTLGVLVAIAVSAAILALAGTRHISATSPVAASHVSSGPVAHYTCLGAARERCLP